MCRYYSPTAKFGRIRSLQHIAFILLRPSLIPPYKSSSPLFGCLVVGMHVSANSWFIYFCLTANPPSSCLLFSLSPWPFRVCLDPPGPLLPQLYHFAHTSIISLHINPCTCYSSRYKCLWMMLGCCWSTVSRASKTKLAIHTTLSLCI